MKWLLFILAFFLIGGAYVMIHTPPKPCKTALVAFTPLTTIQAEVARTPNQMTLGLSDRDYLPNNKGMLFLMPQTGLHMFWMKDTRIPLDIIWIRDNTVVDLITLQPPKNSSSIPHYTPQVEADTVLEVNAGVAQAQGVKKGSSIYWTYPCVSRSQ